MAIKITTLKGAGLSPFGSGLAGFGSISTETYTSRQDLVIDDGPLKGQIGDCRLIDPITKDYKYNDNGYMVGGIGIQQQVYLALLTVKGSSAQLNLGQEYSNVRTIGSNFEVLITQEVEASLFTLTDSKKIKLNNVVPIKDSNNNTLVRIDVKWTDLTTNIDHVNQI